MEIPTPNPENTGIIGWFLAGGFGILLYKTFVFLVGKQVANGYVKSVGQNEVLTKMQEDMEKLETSVGSLREEVAELKGFIKGNINHANELRESPGEPYRAG